MIKTKGEGILAVWSEVPDDLEQEYNDWYNQEHLYERLSVPGILSAARYESVTDGPKHLAIYELESVKVLESPEYLNFKKYPSDWSRRMSPEIVGTTYIRNVYVMIHPEIMPKSHSESGMAEAIQIGRMNIPNHIEKRWSHWYNTIYIPNYETVPGIIKGRRFKTIEGTPKYMTLYEMTSQESSKSAEWDEQQNAHPLNASMRSAMEHIDGSPGIWVKTFEVTKQN